MEVCRGQHDKRLHKLLESIEVKYGFRPCSRRIVPRGDRATVFGVRRWRTYSDDEQNSAKWLSIDIVDARIGGIFVEPSSKLMPISMSPARGR